MQRVRIIEQLGWYTYYLCRIIPVMDKKEEDEKKRLIKWIKLGCQRRAIARALTEPMTPKEMCKVVHPFDVCITERDIWWLMKQFKQQGLIECLTPKELTCKIYFLTDLGRQVVKEAFGIEVKPLPKGIDWGKYSWVARGRARKAVLLKLGESAPEQGWTAARLRKALLDRYPIGMNPIGRVLKQLVQYGLAEYAESANSRKVYELTEQGKAIRNQIGLQIRVRVKVFHEVTSYREETSQRPEPALFPE